ncbi:MAG: 16S rRNA (cytidine(1402)-2'-O)-methyltransferase [Myxococcota bacterium]|nr:16S rRNA (cytidine(1402)-2'-O)-methyltransferase [Myxococcota bacterium]
MSTEKQGDLFLVSVPIGNLEDITVRASRLLADADIIACEDTRQTAKLMDLLGIAKPRLVSMHDHNESRRIPELLNRLEQGDKIVLVSDAGTPTISDPGFGFVNAAIDAGYQPIPIPGACAVIAALSASGLSTATFRFLGFLPHKENALRKCFQAVERAEDTLVFYVGPHHIERAIGVAVEVFGPDRRAVIARELTKKFEEFNRGTLGDLQAEPGTVRGEMVLLIDGFTGELELDEEAFQALVMTLRAEGLSTSKIAKDIAGQIGMARGEVYKRVMSVLS